MTNVDQDSRLWVRFGTAGGGAAVAARGVVAWLIEDGPAGRADGLAAPGHAACVARFAMPATAHAIGCACCLPRGPAALALGRLFLARARGESALFDGVVVLARTQAGVAAVRAALDEDVVTRARFRLAPDGGLPVGVPGQGSS